MTTRRIRSTALATIDGVAYAVRVGSSARLDSADVPYASATLELPMLGEAALEALDPRDGARVSFTHSIDGAPRPFDLAVRRRPADHRAKTVTIDLAGDEMLLQKYKALVTDAGARASQASCRAVCNYVLGKIGAALEPGTDDADVTAYWPITNLLPNPVAATNATGWGIGQNATAPARIVMGSPVPPVGPGTVVTWTAPAAGVSTVVAGTPSTFRVTPGRTYVFTFYICTGAPARNVRAALQWRNSLGNGIVSTVYGDVVSSDNTQFRRVHVIATAPEGAEWVWPFVDTAGNSAGQAHFVTGGMLYEGNELVEFFYGATADSATYLYDWVDPTQPNNTASTRAPVTERRPELFVWKPGVSAWDFLVAITTAVGLVLWCDEQRRWRLATPENRTIVQLLSVTEANTRAGTDTIDLDDEGTTPTGVVVKFTWTDRDGIRHEEYDSAGTPERVAVIELTDRAYPGPGIAGAILARRQGTGRRQDVDTITQITATPGMTAQISLPAAPDTVGRVASVEFDLHTGFMTLGMAGLVDIIPGSIDALVGTIDGLVGTIDSL